MQVKNKTSSQLFHEKNLFDSCSQIYYVTPNLKRKLNVASIKQRNISIQTFGEIHSRDTLEQVELCAISNNDKEIPINCFAKDICTPVTSNNLAETTHISTTLSYRTLILIIKKYKIFRRSRFLLRYCARGICK